MPGALHIIVDEANICSSFATWWWGSPKQKTIFCFSDLFEGTKLGSCHRKCKPSPSKFDKQKFWSEFQTTCGCDSLHFHVSILMYIIYYVLYSYIILTNFGTPHSTVSRCMSCPSGEIIQGLKWFEGPQFHNIPHVVSTEFPIWSTTVVGDLFGGDEV